MAGLNILSFVSVSFRRDCVLVSFEPPARSVFTDHLKSIAHKTGDVHKGLWNCLTTAQLLGIDVYRFLSVHLETKSSLDFGGLLEIIRWIISQLFKKNAVLLAFNI